MGEQVYSNFKMFKTQERTCTKLYKADVIRVKDWFRLPLTWIEENKQKTDRTPEHQLKRSQKYPLPPTTNQPSLTMPLHF